MIAVITEALWLGVLRRSAYSPLAPPRGASGEPIPELILLLWVLHLVYLIACFFALQGKDFRARWVLIPAVAFRLTALAMEPRMSDDLGRYAWEGRIQVEGRNPYATRPTDTGDLGVTGRDFRAVYGPLWEWIQYVTARLGAASTLAWKLPSALADLAVVILLLRLRPRETLLYAWSPLAIFEFWGQGHNDAFVVLFLTLAVAAREGIGRWVGVPGVWIGFAAAIKWWPLMLLPALAKRWADWLVAPAIAALTALPYVAGMSIENAQFATGFVGGWRNNDSLFGLLLAATGDVYRAKYVAFALIALATLAIARTPWSPGAKALATVTALLALSANVHPWYLSWLVALTVWRPNIVILLWAALMPLAYETVIWWSALGEWWQSAWVRWTIYAPVLATAVCCPFFNWIVAKWRARR